MRRLSFLAFALSVPVFAFAQPPESPETDPNESEIDTNEIDTSENDTSENETVTVEPAIPEAPVVPEPPAIPNPPAVPSLPTYRVRSGANEARAFVYRDARHLVTTANVVADRGSLRLVTDDGAAPNGARLEVVSVEGGLALLRADVDLGAPATVGTLTVGDRVRRDETVALALTMDEERLRTSEICVAGAPLTNERGELVAVCTSRTDARLASQLDALWESTSGAPSRWRARLTIGFDYRVRQDFEPVLGGEVGFGVLGYDRIGFLVRTAFFQNAKSDDESIRLRSAFEIGAEVQLQHAFRFGALPVRIGLGLGATYRPVKERRIQELLELEPGCDPSAGPCAATYTRTRTDSDTDHRVLPTARFGIALGGLAFAYTAAIDVDEPKRTTHTLTIGTGL